MLKAGSLFTGIGGLDLGLETAGLCRSEWLAENDPDACTVLAQRYPDIPNLGDVTAIDWAEVEPVDVMHGGFPCQDVSKVGKRAGLKEGTRSGLWFKFAIGIRYLRPRLVIVENVSGLLVRGFGTVLGDLAEIGYDARWSVLRASDVGAAHGRERIFIVAVPSDLPRERRILWQDEEHAAEAGFDALSDLASNRLDVEERWRDTSDGRSAGGFDWRQFGPAVRRWERVLGRPHPEPWVDGQLNADFSEWHLGFPAGWTAELPYKARMKVLGNTVVPQCAEVVGLWAGKMTGEDVG